MGPRPEHCDGRAFLAAIRDNGVRSRPRSSIEVWRRGGRFLQGEGTSGWLTSFVWWRRDGRRGVAFWADFRTSPRSIWRSRRGRRCSRTAPGAVPDLVIVGNVLSAGHGMNIARQVGVRLGLPVIVPAYTVNMMCGSGLQAIRLGAQAIRAGEAHTVLCGGTSRCPGRRTYCHAPARAGNLVTP